MGWEDPAPLQALAPFAFLVLWTVCYCWRERSRRRSVKEIEKQRYDERMKPLTTALLPTTTTRPPDSTREERAVRRADEAYRRLQDEYDRAVDRNDAAAQERILDAQERALDDQNAATQALTDCQSGP
jgi:hypothetical protein